MAKITKEEGGRERYLNEAKRVRDGLDAKLIEIRATFNAKTHAINANVRAGKWRASHQQQQQQPARNLQRAGGFGGFGIEATAPVLGAHRMPIVTRAPQHSQAAPGLGNLSESSSFQIIDLCDESSEVSYKELLSLLGPAPSPSPSPSPPKPQYKT